MPSAPHVVVLNQYYWPGREATAHLLTELCERLAEDYEVTVVTGLLHDLDAPSGESERNGVRILRVPSTAFERRRLSLRALNYLTFVSMSAVAGASLRPPDLVVGMTDPPIIGAVAVGLARRWRVPVVTVHQDVFPEIAVALRRLDNPALIAALRKTSAFVLRGSTRVVAIGETMRDRLIEKGATPEIVRVIPNWANVDAVCPMGRHNSWSREHGLDGRFVVMHSGNIGYAQDLDTLVRAATFLRDRPELRVLIIGSGARLREVMALARRLEVDTLTFLDYQPRELLSLSLSAADVHVVGLARGLAGFIVPSRFYGVLAAGKPVVVTADPESETARTTVEAGCGVVVPPGRPELLARVLRDAASGRYDLEEMGRRGREWVEREADLDVAAARYLALFDELTGRAAADAPLVQAAAAA